MGFSGYDLRAPLGRRGLLIGAGAWGLVGPTRAGAQTALEREHRIQLEVPLLAEESTAVPISVSVNHPMEPDHFVRSIEVTVDGDPVPDKGRIVLSPASGRAWVAYQMRSGSGGVLRATVECSKHGRFTAGQEFRVAEGGCTTPPTGGKEAIGKPVLRLPGTIRAGETVEVRAKLDHNSYTGLVLRGGKFVRELPEHYVKQMAVYLDDQLVCDFRMTSAVSPNPLVRFALRARTGTLRVVFINSEGLRWETTQPLRV
ncbi:MAG TPA: thiosulfate oxidation carrier protein SoxY [Methylomirabilota bacterium]|nr:thiosulfate oxidation carrier protein SoxY [Methylomirabilota bacterium]